MNMRHYYIWIALQTVANEYFQHIKHQMINQAYQTSIDSMKLIGARRKVFREEAANLKKDMEKKWNFYDKVTTEMAKAYDDLEQVNDLVQFIHDRLDEINIIIEDKTPEKQEVQQ